MACQGCGEGCSHPDHRTAIAAVTPEPPPVRQGGREVLPDLVELLKSRSDFGLRKYGVRLHTGNGRNAYHDALQELLDLFVYLHQADMEQYAAIAALLAVRTDNAQDAIEDPIGHAEREAAGFYRIGKGAMDAVLEALRGR